MIIGGVKSQSYTKTKDHRQPTKQPKKNCGPTKVAVR